VSFSAKSTERLAWQLEQKFLVRQENGVAAPTKHRFVIRNLDEIIQMQYYW
jgi:hypothetical protein